MVRLVLHAAILTFYTLVLGLPAILVSLVLPGGRSFRWFARPWARLIAMTFGTKVMATGQGQIPADRACVYMSNHQSHFDVVALLLTLPGHYAILAKRELFFIPVFGWALWLAGMIPVDRSRRDRAIASIERAARRVRDGQRLLVFAEGTRSPDGNLLPFKKGGFHLALRSGAPIVPVSITGSRQVLEKGSLRIRPGTIRVFLGRPIETGGRQAADLIGLMEEVRAAIQAGLDTASGEGRNLLDLKT